MLHELHTETVPNVLRDEDFNSMYHMIESRAPFLAEDIIDAAEKLEDSKLFELGLAKSPLRSYGLGLNNKNDAFMRAHKIGFNLSFWELTLGIDSQICDLIMDCQVIRGLINGDRLVEIFKEKPKDNYISKALFNLTSLAILSDELSGQIN